MNSCNCRDRPGLPLQGAHRGAKQHTMEVCLTAHSYLRSAMVQFHGSAHVGGLISQAQLWAVGYVSDSESVRTEIVDPKATASRGKSRKGRKSSQPQRAAMDGYNLSRERGTGECRPEHAVKLAPNCRRGAAWPAWGPVYAGLLTGFHRDFYYSYSRRRERLPTAF